MPAIEVSLVFLVSFSVSFYVLPALSLTATRMGLLDRPTARKDHAFPIPAVGGIGMILAMATSSILFLPDPSLVGFYLGVSLLFFVGLADDIRGLGWRWKLLAQVAASLLMIRWSGVRLCSLGDFLGIGPVLLGDASLAMTVFCTVGVVNALNLMDGLDGLAGGISLVAFIAFAFLSHVNGQTGVFVLCLVLAGAVTGFLRYNWYPSRLFMGDAGSLTLGFSLVFLSIAVTQKAGSAVSPVAPLLILAVPIVDTVSVMARRLCGGKSPFKADRNHLHHRLIGAGMDKKKAVLLIHSVTFVLSLVAVGGTAFGVGDFPLFLVFLAYLAFSLAFPRVVPTRLRVPDALR